MLVPTIGETDILDLTSIHWILVLEKEVGMLHLEVQN